MLWSAAAPRGHPSVQTGERRLPWPDREDTQEARRPALRPHPGIPGKSPPGSNPGKRCRQPERNLCLVPAPTERSLYAASTKPPSSPTAPATGDSRTKPPRPW
jgi:hypothetical protein